MAIKIREKITDNVFGAVWLAALILTYEKIVLNNQSSDLDLKQSEIQKLAQEICIKTVHPARVSQWCNGDHPNSSYNYLRAVGGKRRLTKVGEYSYCREYPDKLLNNSDRVFFIEEINKEVIFGELFDWLCQYSNASLKCSKPLLTSKSESLREINNSILEKPDYIKLDAINEESSFKRINIRFEYFNKEDLFASLRNKTVRETIEKPRYAKFENEILRSYQGYKNYSIGDFLHHLKENNDQYYRKFLNPYGDEKYCKFKIIDETVLNQKGLYSYVLQGGVMYIGRCRDSFYSRINIGYGYISPKNCYVDGQATNCHINSKINSAGEGIELWIASLENEIEIIECERILIKKYQPKWNIALK